MSLPAATSSGFSAAMFRITASIALAFAGAGCTHTVEVVHDPPAPCPSTGPSAPAAPLASLPASEALRIQAEGQCFEGNGKLTVQALIRSKYTTPRGPLSDANLWSVDCSTSTGECEGFVLNLAKPETGKPIAMLDAATLHHASIAARTGSLVTIKWGPWRTLTVDLAAHHVSFAESDGASEEGRGEADCGR
jgi:hypothetical protein